ncbi:MAG: hypothetical protein M8315_03215, partial [Nitrosopumilus sp.]|nr:hypothetical protein [Nitrosopumilus sp.]
MQGKLAGFGILSLFLIMLVPVYGEVTEFSIEKNFYTIDEGVVFVGDTDEEREQISITIVNPNGKESLLTGTVSNIQGEFETMAKSVEDSFSIIGMYELTAFTTQKDNGIKMILEFDGNSISEPTKYVLQLNSIRDKIAETETTVSFTASITDSSITNAVYNLENAPVDATIDPITGKFIWTPSKSYGSFKDVIYNFDIIVKHDNQEDRENISITVKKAYDEPVIEPNVEPVIEPNVEPVIEPNVEPVIEQTKSTVASFVDQTKDPQSYVNRYNDEPTYKEWFDENYSQYSSIYEAVGLEEPEFGICGDGTKLINGICTIIQKMIEK